MRPLKLNSDSHDLGGLLVVWIQILHPSKVEIVFVADIPNPGAFRAALALSVSVVVWSAAVNVLNQKYGTFIPDWTIVAAIYTASGFWLYWAWHTEFVRRCRALVYTYPRMALILIVLIGMILGGVAGVLLWWAIQREHSQSSSAKRQQEGASMQAHFRSRYTPITDTPDTAISFMSTILNTSRKMITFKARIGHSVDDGMARLVIDLPEQNWFEAFSYAVEHQDEILARVKADIRAAHPDLLDVPVDRYMIVQHHHDHNEVIRVIGRNPTVLIERAPFSLDRPSPPPTPRGK